MHEFLVAVLLPNRPHSPRGHRKQARFKGGFPGKSAARKMQNRAQSGIRTGIAKTVKRPASTAIALPLRVPAGTGAGHTAAGAGGPRYTAGGGT